MRYLVSLTTTFGKGYAELHVRSLQQLAILMPASVIAYEVRVQVEAGSGPLIEDEELYDLLVGIIDDIAKDC